MDINARRLLYINTTRSITTIADTLSVSASVVKNTMAGVAKIGTDLKKQIRNYYQREVYANLRYAGASAVQARRFTWYRPEINLDVGETLRQSVEMLKVAWVARKNMLTGEMLSGNALTEELRLAEEIILENMRKSSKTIEQIYTSGGKQLWTI